MSYFCTKSQRPIDVSQCLTSTEDQLVTVGLAGWCSIGTASRDVILCGTIST